MKANSIQMTARVEQWVFLTLGLAGLVSVVLAIGSFTNFVKGKEQAIAQWSGGKPPSHMTAWRYVKLGYWRADIRTLGSIAVYLLESEPEIPVAGANLERRHVVGNADARSTTAAKA